jgi:hypothetical protein
MKYEKYLHLGLGVLALGLSFAADALGITLSDDSLWIIRGFAGAALGLGALKSLKADTSKDG